MLAHLGDTAGKLQIETDLDCIAVISAATGGEAEDAQAKHDEHTK